MTQKEKKYTQELCALIRQLPHKEQERFRWMAEGVIFARSGKDGSER